MSDLDFTKFFESCKNAPNSTKIAIRTCKFVEAKALADAAEFQKRLIMQEFRPSRIYPTSMQHDGFRWVCRYVAGGQVLLEDDATGVEAYGQSPEEAMCNFDMLWIGDHNQRSNEPEEPEGEDI